MGHQMPPDDDPIIRSIREAGVRPLRPIRGGLGTGRRRGGRPPVIVGVALLVFLFMLVVPTVAMRLTDWLWYREIGFERVFLTKIVGQWTLGLTSGLFAFALLYGNALFALRGGAATTRGATPMIGVTPLGRVIQSLL